MQSKPKDILNICKYILNSRNLGYKTQSLQLLFFCHKYTHFHMFMWYVMTPKDANL